MTGSSTSYFKIYLALFGFVKTNPLADIVMYGPDIIARTDEPTYFLRPPIRMKLGSNQYGRAGLSRHNEHRAKHRDTPPMVHEQRLCADAQNYANNLAQQNIGLFHDGDELDRLGQGENLAMKGSTQPFATNDPRLEYGWAVDGWYDEIKDYDFSSPGFKSGTGHFTQVIWKESTSLCMAHALSSDRHTLVVVARYKLRGNVWGKFDSQVSPLRGPNDLITNNFKDETAELPKTVAPPLPETVAPQFTERAPAEPVDIENINSIKDLPKDIIAKLAPHLLLGSNQIEVLYSTLAELKTTSLPVPNTVRDQQPLIGKPVAGEPIRLEPLHKIPSTNVATSTGKYVHATRITTMNTGWQNARKLTTKVTTTKTTNASPTEKMSEYISDLQAGSPVPTDAFPLVDLSTIKIDDIVYAIKEGDILENINDSYEALPPFQCKCKERGRLINEFEKISVKVSYACSQSYSCPAGCGKVRPMPVKCDKKRINTCFFDGTIFHDYLPSKVFKCTWVKCIPTTYFFRTEPYISCDDPITGKPFDWSKPVQYPKYEPNYWKVLTARR